MANSTSDPAASAIRKLDAWYQTLPTAERQVIARIVQAAVTPPQERLNEDVTGYEVHAAACRGFAGNNAPTIVGDLTSPRGVGIAAVFLNDGPPVR